jgi:hypothetical protein
MLSSIGYFYEEDFVYLSQFCLVPEKMEVVGFFLSLYLKNGYIIDLE